MLTVRDLIDRLEDIAPPDLADESDRIGLQVGDRAAEVRRVCVAVDASDPIIDNAIAARADLLVTHHPLIYAPMTAVAEGSPVEKCVAKLIRSNVALFVMHTNYDTADGGVNDVLAEQLGVFDTTPLTSHKQEKLFKIAVFVPEEAIAGVRSAMADAGAGVIGDYTHCSFRTAGTGSFVAGSSAQPYVGGKAGLEEVDEYRLEMVCAGSRIDRVIAAMIQQHPYEEVAYDVYELANQPVRRGYGRVGVLREEITLGRYAERVISALGVRHPKVFGDRERTLRRVAFCSGGGSSLYREAAKSGADVFVTGDTKHHDIIDAEALGLSVIDAGHFETEKPGMVDLAGKLRSSYFAGGLEIEYIE